MTKQEFQNKVKQLKKRGITQTAIAKKIGYSESQVRRAYSNNWKGDCSKVINAFNKTFK